MRVILVRHGETSWSKEDRYLGTSDISLNDLGVKQAKIAAQVLKRKDLNIVYSSMLKRAVDTAEIIAKECAVPLRKDARLNELSFGVWEGLTFAEIKERNPNVWRKWQELLETFSPPKGESIGELRDRVSSFFCPLINKLKDRTIVIVSHEGPIKIILLHALGAPLSSFWRFKQNLGAFSTVQYYHHGSLVTSLNETSHLIGA